MGSSVVRKERLLLDGHTCCNCKSEATQVHHIVPLVLGGTDTLGNTVSLCDGCHAKVHGKKACDHVALTKAGLAAARERGVQLGGARPHLPEHNRQRANRALQHAHGVAPLVFGLRERGATLQEVADALNEAGLTTPRGTQWRPTQVVRVLKRLKDT
jgi:hypothetical protein